MPVELFANQAVTTVASGGSTAPVSGTQESWTVTSSALFPAASSSATPQTQFHVADTAAGKTSEIITVINVSGFTWTVIRGAENTTPITHAAGFSVQQVMTAGFVSAAPVSVLASGDTSGVTDYKAISSLLGSNVRITLGAGQFWLSQPIVPPQDVWTYIDGAADGATILSPANAANCDVIQGAGFSSLTNSGTATATGAGPFLQLSNLIIDGNSSGQTLSALTNASCVPSTPPPNGYGIRVYGRNWKIYNVDVRNCFAYGMWTEWGTGPSNTVYQNGSVEGRAINVKVYNNGAHGWYHRGPTDCQFADVLCFQNNAAALNAGLDFWAEADGTTNGSGTNHFSPNGLQLINSHFWGTTAKWNLVLDCTASAANCHSEGAANGCALFRGPVKWTGGSPYYIAGQVSSWGVGVQFGDVGSTSGVPTTASYAANVAYFGAITGTMCDTAARAGIVWANCSQSIVDALVIARTAPTATVAAGSNGVNVSTFTGTGSLSFSGGTSMPPAGGTLTVATSGGTATITYTSISGGAFQGCNTTAGTGTLSTGGAITLANIGTVGVTGTIDTGSDVAIEVNGSGLGAGVPQLASTHYARGKHRLDIGSQSQGFFLTNAGTDILNVSTSGNRIEGVSGPELRLYSDVYTTPTVRIGGASGHIGTGVPNGKTLGIAAAAGAGTAPPTPTLLSSSTDTQGQVSLGTGTGPAAGAQATLTFATAYVGTPIVVVCALNAATAALQPYVLGGSAAGFNIAFAVAPSASQTVGTYGVNYIAIARGA